MCTLLILYISCCFEEGILMLEGFSWAWSQHHEASIRECHLAKINSVFVYRNTPFPKICGSSQWSTCISLYYVLLWYSAVCYVAFNVSIRAWSALSGTLPPYIWSQPTSVLPNTAVSCISRVLGFTAAILIALCHVRLCWVILFCGLLNCTLYVALKVFEGLTSPSEIGPTQKG